MSILCHQISHDETLNVKDDIKQKKLTTLFIPSKLYFEATSDLTGTYIYMRKNFKSYTVIIIYCLTNKSNYNYIFMQFYTFRTTYLYISNIFSCL